MNEQQRLYLVQARSDFDAYKLLCSGDAAPCHQLHYLQMVTEKLSKAYLWGQGTTPKKTHAGFQHFVRGLHHSRDPKERDRVANVLGFRNYAAFQRWTSLSLPIARAVERLAPSLAADGPNPEYPWPPLLPEVAPVEHEYSVWRDLNQSNGRQFLITLGRAVDRFEEYA